MCRICSDAIASVRIARIMAAAMLCCFFAGPATAQTQYVEPIDWSRFSQAIGAVPQDAFGQKLVTLIQKHSKYALWEINQPTNYSVHSDFQEHIGTPFYWPYTRGANHEQSIRPLSNLAIGTAIMLKTGIYDADVAGVSADEALHRAVLAINGAALTHRGNGSTNNHRWGGGGFGTDNSRWQSAYWAAQTASAAWMLWDDLPSETQGIVAKMVEYEANSFIGYEVPYWKNSLGETNFGGDTKAEENSWNAMMLGVAQSMMPGHPNAPLWREKASELQASVHAIRTDNFPWLSGSQSVDGKPVHQWVNGYNLFDNGVVVNHRVVQPDYMIGAATLHFATAIHASLAGRYIPESTFFNADPVYRGLTEVHFEPGPDTVYGTGKNIIGPGGTIFKKTGSGDDAVYSALVYYPQGEDWVRIDIPIVTEGHLNFDLYAEFLGLDAGKDFDAMGWAEARVDRLLEMQARSGEAGNIYQPGDWVASSYFSQEQSIFMSITEAWMQHWLISNKFMSPIGDSWEALPVPEPCGVCLFLMGIAATAAYRRRQRRLIQ